MNMDLVADIPKATLRAMYITIVMIVKVLKGVTSLQLFKKYPDLKEKLWKGHLWSPSYYVGTAGRVTSENVRRYIEEQKGNSSTQ